MDGGNMLGVNPWLKIWTKPRETIRAIVAFNPKYRFLLLSAFYGFPCLLNIAQASSLGQSWSLLAILVGALLLSTFVGMISISVTSFLILWTGKWIKGTASYQEIRTAVAWSNAPNGVNVLIWLGLIAYFGANIFAADFIQKVMASNPSTALSLLFFLQTILSVWSIVILINGIAEVQRFTGWKAFLNVVMALVIIVLLMWIIAVVVGAAAGSSLPPS